MDKCCKCNTKKGFNIEKISNTTYKELQDIKDKYLDKATTNIVETLGFVFSELKEYIKDFTTLSQKELDLTSLDALKERQEKMFEIRESFSDVAYDLIKICEETDELKFVFDDFYIIHEKLEKEKSVI